MKKNERITNIARKNAFDLGLWFYTYTSLLFRTDDENYQELNKKLRNYERRLNQTIRYFKLDLEFIAPEDPDSIFEYSVKLTTEDEQGQGNVSVDIYANLLLMYGDLVASLFRLAFGLSVYSEGAKYDNSDFDNIDFDPTYANGEMRNLIVRDADIVGIPDKLLRSFFSDPRRYYNSVCEYAMGKDAEDNVVFIVHGHNHTIRDKIDIYVRDLGLKTRIMSAEANIGRTLAEKFESVADLCAFAVFILSADDHLIYSNTGKEVRRARQNVILEVGYFWGALGRTGRSIFLVEADPVMELPSDLHGIGWIPITDDLAETKIQLKRELEAAGLLKENLP